MLGMLRHELGSGKIAAMEGVRGDTCQDHDGLHTHTLTYPVVHLLRLEPKLLLEGTFGPQALVAVRDMLHQENAIRGNHDVCGQATK